MLDASPHAILPFRLTMTDYTGVGDLPLTIQSLQRRLQKIETAQICKNN